MRLFRRGLATAAAILALLAAAPTAAHAILPAPVCQAFQTAWTCSAPNLTTADGPFRWTIVKVGGGFVATVFSTQPTINVAGCGNFRVTYTLPTGETSPSALVNC